MRESRRNIGWFRAVLVVEIGLACFVLVSCKGSADNRDPQARPDVRQSGSATGNDPCSLLSAAEVASAIGPLAGPPYTGESVASPSDDACRYDTKDYRRIIVSVDWDGGKAVMGMMGAVRNLTDSALQGKIGTGGTVLNTGDTLRGNWDRIAMPPAACCSLDALSGDSHVRLDWTGTHLTPVTAATLLSTAMTRLSRPLAVNGAAGLAAARQRWALMAKDSAVDACKLVSQAGAEAIVGSPLSSPPDHGAPNSRQDPTMCNYRTTQANMPGIPIEYSIWIKYWNDAHASFAEDQAIFSGAVSTANSATSLAGPWDEIGSSASNGYEVVKGPLLVIGTTNGDRAKSLALLAKAVGALP